ncbi:MAG TPA: hypothetical protein GX514_09145 [Thermoanaerobacterales bacterium]|nr:hypothetical protein [Thermoanaerobacterales bacterium]
MIEVSEKFVQYSRARNREVEAIVEISEGDDFRVFDKQEIVEFEIHSAITAGDDFSIGNVITSRLNLSLLTDYTPERNATVKPYIRFNGAEGPSEWLQLGVFKIDSRRKRGNVWQFECYDDLIKTRMPYKTNLHPPTTTKQILLEALLNLGLEIDEEQLENMEEFQVTRRLESNSYSYRDVLGYIASMHAANIIMDHRGKLKFVYVDDREPKLVIEPNEYSNLNILNESKVYTKVVANAGSAEREQLSIGDGDLDNTLFISNPIVTEEILESIYNKILGITYTGVDVGKWRCFPFLEPGDFVVFKQRNGQDILTVIQTQTIRYAGGISGKMSSPSKSYLTSEFGFVGDLARALGNIQNRIGVYALSENARTIEVNTQFQGKIVLPVTTLDATDLEFTITAIGTATTDTVLHLEIRSTEGVLGKSFKTVLREGINTVSINTLVRSIQQFSDNLVLFMRVERGRFTIEPLNAQFYAYGANLIGDSGIPYAAIEDVVEFKSYINSDNVITIATIPDRAVVVDVVTFENFINSDSVDVLTY